MQPSGKIKVVDLNQHLTCVLCGGYYIDATTIIECLHSFCKTCIVRYLQTNKFCPICDVQVHKTRPLVNIRSDQTLQDIVYKLVPGLFKSEMKRRREFYSQQAKIAKSAVPSSSEKRGEVLGSERLIFTPEDIISVSMEYCPPNLTFPLRLQPTNGDYTVSLLHSEGVTKSESHRRYLRCPGAITVGHLKRLLRAKYGLLSYHKIDVMYMHDYLYDEYTLMDLAYIYSWRRNGPLRLFYKIYERPAKTQKKTAAEKLEVVLPLSCESSQVTPSSTEVAVPAPAPSVATAPASQSHLQRHPSPPPSPQMAVEPDYVKISKPNSAALLNGQQVKLHEHESAANVTENSTYSSEKKVIPYLDNSVKLVVNFHPVDRKKRNPVKLPRKSAVSHVLKSGKVNGIRKESQTQVAKHFLPRKSS